MVPRVWTYSSRVSARDPDHAHLSLCPGLRSAATLQTTPRRSFCTAPGPRSAAATAAERPRAARRTAGGRASRLRRPPWPSAGTAAWDRSTWTCWLPLLVQKPWLRTYSLPVRQEIRRQNWKCFSEPEILKNLGFKKNKSSPYNSAPPSSVCFPAC